MSLIPKKLRKKQKRYQIRLKKNTKEHVFCVCISWPNRGFRIKQIQSDDAFDAILNNFSSLFIYPLEK